MKTFVQDGKVVPFTAPAGGVVSGTGVKIGDVLVVATVDAAAGETFNGVAIGIVEHAKNSAEAWAEGDKVNWDDAAKEFTTATTGNFLAGHAAAVAANPTSTGKVILRGTGLGAALA